MALNSPEYHWREFQKSEIGPQELQGVAQKSKHKKETKHSLNMYFFHVLFFKGAVKGLCIVTKEHQQRTLPKDGHTAKIMTVQGIFWFSHFKCFVKIFGDGRAEW